MNYDDNDVFDFLAFFVLSVLITFLVVLTTFMREIHKKIK